MAREADTRRALGRARSVLAATAFTARSRKAAYRAVAQKLTVVPAGVSERFAAEPEPGESQRLQRRHGLPAGDEAGHRLGALQHQLAGRAADLELPGSRNAQLIW